MISPSAIFREAMACFISGAAFTLLVVMAYFFVPSGIVVPGRPSRVLAVLGIVTFFCLTPLEPRPNRLVFLRSLSLLMIGAGILARILPKISYIQSGLKLFADDVLFERSLAVSTVLLCSGFTILAGYYMTLLYIQRRKPANQTMDRSRL